MNSVFFPLLVNRLLRERQQTPQFIGEFHGVEGLPAKVTPYPAFYWWVDTSIGSTRLSMNTPLLEDWCVEEAAAIGIRVSPNDEEVKQALAQLNQLTIETFRAVMAGR